MEGLDFLVAGIENPLLDIQIEIETQELLEKYGLQHGQACLADEKHQPLFAELWKTPGIMTIPGGSSLNSIRAANHMLRDTHPRRCAYFGSIGKDEIGETLKKELEETGVHGHFHIDEETPTGSCAVLIH
jgi:adenosine kinase